MNYKKISVTSFGTLAAGLFALTGCTVDTSESGEDVSIEQGALNQVFWASGTGSGYVRRLPGPGSCQVVDGGSWHAGWLTGTGSCKYTVSFFVKSGTTSMKTLRIDGGTPVWTPGAHYTPIPQGAIKSDSGKYVCFSNGGDPGERDTSGQCRYVGVADGAFHITDSYLFVSSGPIIIPNP